LLAEEEVISNGQIKQAGDHVPGGGLLVELVGGVEDEQRDLGVTEEGELKVRHRGRRGAWPSSGKKRGAAIVVGEEEGRRLQGEEGRRLSSSAAVILARVSAGEEVTRVGEKGQGEPFYPKSWLCVAHPSEVRYG
jgi:hypothetical protein